MIDWLQVWYAERCDGDWEHEYGVSIENIDNPGWSVKIDLACTILSDLEIPYVLHETSEKDWFSYSIQSGVFKGTGDPLKLHKIVETFKAIWDSH